MPAAMTSAQKAIIIQSFRFIQHFHPFSRQGRKRMSLCPSQTAKTRCLFWGKMRIYLFGSTRTSACSPCTASRSRHPRWERIGFLLLPKYLHRKFRTILPITLRQSAASLSPPSIFATATNSRTVSTIALSIRSCKLHLFSNTIGISDKDLL